MGLPDGSDMGVGAIFSSAVMTGQDRVRAVATMRRSAGSLWKGSGRLTAARAMALSTGMKTTLRRASTLESQSSRVAVKWRRPDLMSKTISQVVMDETEI